MRKLICLVDCVLVSLPITDRHPVRNLLSGNIFTGSAKSMDPALFILLCNEHALGESSLALDLVTLLHG